jgi:mono/diheme cytochrome c family protein
MTGTGRTTAFAGCAVALLASVITAGAGRPAVARQPAAEPASASHRAVLEKYCFTCHNARLHTADLVLDVLDDTKPSEHPEVWEKVIRKLRTQTMPPGGRPRPDDATYDELATWLETNIDRAAAANPDPGRTEAFHRLNRAEYQNAVRDLLDIDVNVAALLPADNTYENGFDNNAAALSITPSQIERYLSAAGRIGRLAVGIAPRGPGVETYRVPLNLLQDDRMSEDLPFGSRGGVAIHHYFPTDGEYSLKIVLQKSYNDYVRGMGTRQTIDVRVDGAIVKKFPIGGEAKGKAPPASFAGNIYGDPEWERYVLTADAGLDVRFPAKAGPRVVSVSFERAGFEPEGIVQPQQSGFELAADERYDGHAAIDTVAIGGPYSSSGPGDTPSRRRIFVCQPTDASREDACAAKILANLARRAYRRPSTPADVDTLMAFYNKGRAAAGDFNAGVELALERLLIDPDFLTRVERDPAGVADGAVYHLTEIELASRLSFFLWNSIPDDELLGAAARGELQKAATLDRQVRRMLADPRSRVLVTNFASQWLNLRNLDGALPDPDRYPNFDENLRDALQQETELFVESTIREGRSVVDLVGADYTFVNERLAKHYGIPNIYGNRFQRVTFPPGAQRGGLLGQGSILTLSSYPTRTSPVLRGKWVLQNIFGTIPPEPPPNIPALPEPGEGGRSRSVRALLEAHRKNPSCAACHAAMDPLGFALENFDAVGAWRSTTEAGEPLDVSGVMPNGQHFEGPAGLRALLLSRREQFVTTLTEKLLAYGLGRALEYYDRPTVRQIVTDAARDDYRWSAIITGIVHSAPFEMRRAKSAAKPAQTAASLEERR